MKWDQEYITRLANKAHLSVTDVAHGLDVMRECGLKGMGQEANDALLVCILRSMASFTDGMTHSPAGAANPQSINITGPPEWRAHTRKALDQYLSERRRILGLFGLEKPLTSWECVAPLLEQMARDQSDRGESAWLVYPAGDAANRHTRGVTVFEGRQDPASVGLEMRRGLPVRPDGSFAGLPPASPLWELLETASDIADETDLLLPDVVTWLLSDEAISLPWITVDALPTSVNTYVFTISIYDLSVRPDEVADAWKRVLSDPVAVALRHYSDDYASIVRPLISMSGITRTRTTDRVAVMVSFVDAWKREHKGARPSWPNLCREFNETYPEWEFTKSESMRTQYEREKRRERERTSRASEGAQDHG